MKPVMLMILDGWGIAPAGPYNAAKTAKTPELSRLFETYPHTRLLASGNAVGLPEGQMGNSEVGHLNIGAGRIVYQELTRITKACEEGTLLQNKALLECMARVKQNGGALHLMGLLSDGGVHSHESHLWALLKMAKANGLEKVYVHAFLDGRDVGPSTALTYVERLQKVIDETGCGEIATISGRYYAMDRDKRWARTQKAYDAITLHSGKTFASAAEGIEASYAAGVTDEFVEPFVVASENDSRVKDGDGVIFFDFTGFDQIGNGQTLRRNSQQSLFETLPVGQMKCELETSAGATDVKRLFRHLFRRNHHMIGGHSLRSMTGHHPAVPDSVKRLRQTDRSRYPPLRIQQPVFVRDCRGDRQRTVADPEFRCFQIHRKADQIAFGNRKFR